MLERVEEVIIKFAVCIVLCLLGNAFLDGRHRDFVVLVEAVSAFGAEVFAEGFDCKGPRLHESGVETGLADEVVLNRKCIRSYIASIHQYYIKQ